MIIVQSEKMHLFLKHKSMLCSLCFSTSSLQWTTSLLLLLQCNNVSLETTLLHRSTVYTSRPIPVSCSRVLATLLMCLNLSPCRRTPPYLTQQLAFTLRLYSHSIKTPNFNGDFCSWRVALIYKGKNYWILFHCAPVI